ncbi:MAG: Transposase, Mutator family [bacterium ADurb.Bin429]|nr:MAG: Transposase, Mutator family [bacterium ADurb.Bin429]
MNTTTTDATRQAQTGLVTVNEEELRTHLDQIVTGAVEATLNPLLDAEADALCQARRYERTATRQDTRAGHYTRKLQTRAGAVTLKVPKLRQLTFETAIIERYQRREASVEEALIEMYLAGVSVRRVEDITEALWGTKVSASTVSDLNQKLYLRLDEWLARPLTGEYAYVYLDGLWLKKSWGGEVQTVAVLVAVGVSADGYREILGVAEGMKEDTESWRAFLRGMKARGLQGIRLVVSDCCLGLVEALGEVFPQAAWQRCVVHFYRNVLGQVPRGKSREVATMLKAIHAQEDRAAALQKAEAVAMKLRELKLEKAAKVLQAGIADTLAYYAFPSEHWRSLRTNNPLERLNREIRRRTRVVGCFPDGRSAVMLVTARLRYLASKDWGTKRYLNMDRLWDTDHSEEEGT